jgi:SWI/SNF-related matrix-associated actin-dependent regulator of chromatin subfamily A member 5
VSASLDLFREFVPLTHLRVYFTLNINYPEWTWDTQQLGARWRALTDAEREPYLAQEREDRERFERESAEADAERLAEQEARQKTLIVQDGEDASNRGARARLQEERDRVAQEKEERRLKREANMDEEERARRDRIKEEKRLETEERQRKRANQDAALAKQHKKLDKEEAKKASNRLEYLFKQSPIFTKLKMGVGGINDDEKDSDDGDDDGDKKPSPTGRGGRGRAAKNKGKDENGAGKTRPHHIHDKDSADEDDIEEEEEEEEERHVFLTQQPSVIKFGKLKPYQIESLNWMIHLAEKGLNGILADEMGLGKTLQSISILAYHWEYLKISGPHLICVPKSTLSNWMNELKRWCPCLRAIKFHGSREEREAMIEEYFTAAAASHDGRRPEKQIMDENGEMVDDNSDNPRKWGMSVGCRDRCLFCLCLICHPLLTHTLSYLSFLSPNAVCLPV